MVGHASSISSRLNVTLCLEDVGQPTKFIDTNTINLEMIKLICVKTLGDARCYTWWIRGSSVCVRIWACGVHIRRGCYVAMSEAIFEIARVSDEAFLPLGSEDKFTLSMWYPILHFADVGFEAERVDELLVTHNNLRLTTRDTVIGKLSLNIDLIVVACLFAESMSLSFPEFSLIYNLVGSRQEFHRALPVGFASEETTIIL